MATSTLPRPSLPPSPNGGPPTAPLPSLPAKKKIRKSLPAPSTRTSIPSTASIPTTPSRLRNPSSSIPQSSASGFSSPALPNQPRKSIALQPKDKDLDGTKTLKKSISIASFPQPPKPMSRIGRPSLGINTSAEGSASPVPQDDSPSYTPQSAGAPRSKKLKSQSASSTLHSSFKHNSTSLLSGSADTVPVPQRRSGSDGIASAGSPARSRSSSAEGSYSTTATTFEDDDVKGQDSDESVTKPKDGKGAGNVVISVRVRPNVESDTSTEADWMVEGRNSLISYRGKEGGEYYYDNVFASKDDNSKVYDSCARRLVRRVMEGFHGTVFAYGMTGTGKTFSMQGTGSSPGVIPRAVQDIFSYIRETPHREFLLRVSYLEIYNEEIRDLLMPVLPETGPGAVKAEKIKLREDTKGNVYATPLKEEIVQSTNQLLQVIAKGDKSRRTAATQFNSLSSRSHAIVQVVVESRERTSGEGAEGGKGKTNVSSGGVRVSSLSLIDLAGSERAAEDKSRRTEGAHINKSLLTLGTVISRLSTDGKDKDGKHLPYRDSKLTRLLQPALSGNSLISILCTIQIGSKAGTTATAATHTLETLNTLKFAARARNNIVSHAKKAEEAGPGDGQNSALLNRYKQEIANLKGQLETQAMMQAEKQERELEVEAHHRHEEQLLEMQLARTALRERIEHLNQLILSSRSIGVNDTRASMFSTSSRLTSMYNGSDAGTRSVRSSTSVATLQTLNRNASTKSNATINSHFLALRSPHMSYMTDHSPVSPGEQDGMSIQTYAGDDSAALETQVRALQSDIADKNRYINTLEQRLLKARRTSHGRLSQVASPLERVQETSPQEREMESADLKAQLEDRDRIIAELKAQNRTLTNSLMLMSPNSSTSPADFPTPSFTSGAELSKHATKNSTGSLDSGASLSSVEVPSSAMASRRGALGTLDSGTPRPAVSTASSFSSLKTAVTSFSSAGAAPSEPQPPMPRLNRKSVDEMSKMLDEMIQDRVESGQITKSRTGSIHARKGRRQQSMGSVPTVASLDKKRRQSQVGENRISLPGSQEPTPKMDATEKTPEEEVSEPLMDFGGPAVGLGLEGLTT